MTLIHESHDESLNFSGLPCYNISSVKKTARLTLFKPLRNTRFAMSCMYALRAYNNDDTGSRHLLTNLSPACRCLLQKKDR